MIAVVFWISLSIVVGVIAEKRGRSGVGWFFLSTLLISPLLGLVLVLALSPNEKGVEEQALLRGDSKRCPHCAELIKLEAVVCRYCSRELPAISGSLGGDIAASGVGPSGERLG